MDPVLAIVGLAVLAAAVAWWFFRRRTRQPHEDEWTPPPEEFAAPSQDLGPQLLDREALLNRDRTLDPSKWDNTPDLTRKFRDHEGG